MQLGTRWTIGGEPPARLPTVVVAAIRDVESAETTASDRRWTLTWLEGRPIVELDPAPDSDEFTTIRYNDVKGTAIVTRGDTDDAWEDDDEEL